MPVKKWTSPKKKYSKREIKAIEKKRDEEINELLRKDEAKAVFGGIMYGVAKLLTTITYEDPIRKEDVDIKLSGCAGYIPIFNTVEEAKEHTNDGKYQIFHIKVPDNQ